MKMRRKTSSIRRPEPYLKNPESVSFAALNLIDNQAVRKLDSELGSCKVARHVRVPLPSFREKSEGQGGGGSEIHSETERRDTETAQTDIHSTRGKVSQR